MPLIHKRNTTRDDFDRVWTLNLVAADLIATMVALSAPSAARFYSEPGIETFLCFIIAGSLMPTFQNIGTVIFLKQLDFRRDFPLQVSQNLATMVVGIPRAFALRSYWAPVIAAVAGNVASVAISYRSLPYRPRFCQSSWRELSAYSKSLQV